MVNFINFSCLVEYQNVGCFKDNWFDRPIQSLEGSCDLLDGDHWKQRVDAIEKCYRCAKSKGFTTFALMYGGACNADDAGTYAKYGESSVCTDGKGGPWANDVYMMKSVKVSNETSK